MTLHSQLGHGAASRSLKIGDRVRINPPDTTARGICDGDIVRRACLAAAMLGDDLATGRGAHDRRRIGPQHRKTTSVWRRTKNPQCPPPKCSALKDRRGPIMSMVPFPC